MSKIICALTGVEIDIQHQPEEIVRQDVIKRLLGLGYPKNRLVKEIKIPMGSSVKRCDIAIMDRECKPFGLIECKRQGATHAAGAMQLNSYMAATRTTQWGMWTNGKDERFYRQEADGNLKPINGVSIPPFGAGLKDQIKYKDLTVCPDLLIRFNRIKQAFLDSSVRASQATEEFVKFLFLKMQDEHNGKLTPDKLTQFQKGITPDETYDIVNKMWQDYTSTGGFNELFQGTEKMEVGPEMCHAIVDALEGVNILETNTDAIGCAFEVFSDDTFGGEHGQYFTPGAVRKMMVGISNPSALQMVIDPAAGSGGLLIESLHHMTGGMRNGFSRIARNCIFGADIDHALNRISKIHFQLIGDGSSNMVQFNSTDGFLTAKKPYNKTGFSNGLKGKFDLAIMNPPFPETPETNLAILSQYDLGYALEYNNGSVRRGSLIGSQLVQNLFLELGIRLVKPGGKVCIVMPVSLLSSNRDRSVREYIRQSCHVRAVIMNSQIAFIPHTATETCVLLLEKKDNPADISNEPTFLAVSRYCGHDRYNKPIPNDDTQDIVRAYQGEKEIEFSTGGFSLLRHINSDNWSPIYHNIEVTGNTSLGEMEEKGLITIRKPKHVVSDIDHKKAGYRYVRTTDFTEFRPKHTSDKFVSESKLLEFQNSFDLQSYDILITTGGRNKIGQVYMLGDDDLDIVLQSANARIRCSDGISPFLLFWALRQSSFYKQAQANKTEGPHSKHLNHSALRAIRINIPEDPKECEDITNQVKNAFDQMIKSESQLRELGM